MKIFSLLLTTVFALSFASAQTPAPIVVPAASAPATATAAAPAAAQSANVAAALQAVQALKAANEEILKKQAATLQQLDELQKAADQLKIYSKRG